MPFELFMLLGFLAIPLLALLPAPDAGAADGSFRSRRPLRRRDGVRRSAARDGRVTRCGEATRRRHPGRAAA